MKKEGLEKMQLTCNGTLKQPIDIDYGILRKALLTVRAIEHTVRLEILDMLTKKKFLTVTEIYTKLKIEQSVTSQHLAILRRAGILNTDREGKFIHYSLNKQRISEINKLISELN